MRFWIPRYEAQAVNGTRDPFYIEWYRFFRNIWAALGYDPKAPIYADLGCDVMAMDAAGSAVTLETVAGGIKARGFPAGYDAELNRIDRLPSNYRSQTAIGCYLDWMPSDATAGDVVWSLEHATGGNGDAITTTTTEQITDTASGVDSQIQRVTFSNIPAASIGDSLFRRIQRIGTDPADTYAGDALIVGFGLKIELEGMGSDLVFP